MAEPNPFAFTGLGVPQLPSSEASLRAELAKSRQSVVMLQRELHKLRDANGLAAALARAKTDIQEAQRESKRAQLAERIARAALDSLRNSVHEEAEGKAMSQDSVPTQEEVDELRKQLAASQHKNGKLQADLETCKDDLANRSDALRDCIPIPDHERRLQELEDSVHVELEDNKTALTRLEADLRETRSQLATADKELQQLKERVFTAETDLEVVRSDNKQLDHDLEYEKTLVTTYHEDNVNVLADLAAKEAQCQALTRERDTFEAKFTKTLLLLERTRDSEAEVHNEFEQFKAEAHHASRGLTEHNEGLEGELDTLHQENDEHERDLAIKDERIAFLERENDLLEAKLKEEKAHNDTNCSTVRPPTYRSISTTSHVSLADELDAQSDAEFEDDLSDVGESVNLTLTSGVCDSISIAPRNVPAPKLVVSVNDAASIAPRNPEPVALNHSPVSDVSIIEPSQPAPLELSMYDETIASFLPREPAAPTLNQSPVSEINSIAPSQPLTAKHQTLSTYMVDHATLSLVPKAPVATTTRDTTTQTEAETGRKDLAISEISTTQSRYKNSNSSERKASLASSVSSTMSRRRRSPIDPFARLRKPSDTDILDKLPPGYPLEDPTPTIPEPTPAPPRTVHNNTPERTKTALFIHNVLHCLFCVLAFYCMNIRTKLHAWENANGVGVGEGHGNINDRNAPFGNGHVLLSLLPVNLLSADSWIPAKAVDVITSTVSAFEEWVGLNPTLLY